jgi:hypothetical protein
MLITLSDSGLEFSIDPDDNATVLVTMGDLGHENTESLPLTSLEEIVRRLRVMADTDE